MRRRRLVGARALSMAQIAALPGLYARFKGSDLSALANGDPVSSWPDATGHGHAATQATSGKRPAYETNVQNGKAGVRFTLANAQALATAAGAAIGTVATVVVVGRAPVTNPAATQYFIGGSSSGNRRDVYMTTGRALGLQGSTGIIGGPTAPPGVGFIAAAVFDGTDSSVRHDAIPAVGAAGNTANPTLITLGARSNQLENFDGWLLDVLYFTRHLPPAELLSLERGLSVEYGIPLTPAGVAYVDGDNGSDTANTGRSPASPVKTATKAHSILGANFGRMEVTGTLREALNLTTGAQRLVRLSNVTWYASERHTSGWTAQGGGVYSKAVTGYGSTVNHARVVSDIDADGYWRTLQPNTATPTAPAAGQIGISSSTLYVHLVGNVDPNTQTIEVPRLDACIFSRDAVEHVIRRVSGDAKLLMGNRACMSAGAFDVDGRVIAIEIEAGYGGDLGGFATQGKCVSYKRYRCKAYRSMNDGFNVHGQVGWPVYAYSEDCEDYDNDDEGVSYHDATVGEALGEHAYNNIGGGGITNVGTSVVTVDGSAARPTVIEGNRRGAAAVADQGGISAYEAGTVIHVGPDVIIRNNHGSGIFINPASPGSTVDPIAAAASVGNTLPDTLP